VQSAGFPARLSEETQRYRNLKEMSAWISPQNMDSPELGPALRNVCILGAPYETARFRAILLGDSHAEHFGPILDVAAREAGVAIVWTKRSCLPLVGLTRTQRHAPYLPGYAQDCEAYHRLILGFIDASPDIKAIVLAAAWSNSLEELYRVNLREAGTYPNGLRFLEEALPELTAGLKVAEDRKILLISDISRRDFSNSDCLAGSRMLWRAECPRELFETPINAGQRIFQATTDAKIMDFAARTPNVVTLSPQSTMCDATSCRTHENGEILYRDVMHLRMNLLDETRIALARRIKLKEAIESIAPQSMPRQRQ